MSNENKAVRGKEAAAILGISLAMVYKLLETDKKFPRGAKLGRARVWLKNDLLEYLARKAG